MSKEFPEISPQEPVIVENDIDWTVRVDDIPWEEDTIMDLPEGTKSHLVNSNAAEGRTDYFVRFPEGYIEPEHTHEGAHAVVIIDGTMEVHGHTLTSGDYLYGQKLPHGPMEYHCDHADYGCLVFASFVGGSTSHRWDEDPNA